MTAPLAAWTRARADVNLDRVDRTLAAEIARNGGRIGSHSVLAVRLAVTPDRIKASLDRLTAAGLINLEAGAAGVVNDRIRRRIRTDNDTRTAA